MTLALTALRCRSDRFRGSVLSMNTAQMANMIVHEAIFENSLHCNFFFIQFEICKFRSL